MYDLFAAAFWLAGFCLGWALLFSLVARWMDDEPAYDERPTCRAVAHEVAARYWGPGYESPMMRRLRREDRPPTP